VSRTAPILPIRTSDLEGIADRGIPVPTYDRSGLQPRIVHVGVGGFHRAHMAQYTDELAAAGSDWGICGLGLMAHDSRMADALATQDHLYTLTEKGTGTFAPRVIGSIVDYVLAAFDETSAHRLIAQPGVSILSLTITESGYAEPKAGERTTFDVLADCLAARRDAGSGAITVLSCDNLPGNGDVTRRAMLAAAARHSSALLNWVEVNCTFPNSMVDRITPTTADTDRLWLVDNYGIEDQWPVVSEPFRQWVIEDKFVAGRPAWEVVGALFTDNVHAWELYKLRFLNAGHSCMAYLSALAGITFVDEAMATPVVSTFLQRLLHTEALPTVHEIAGHPREDYIAMVLGRFSSTGVRDQIARLCMDGTAKFPTFLIPTVVRQVELSGPIERSALALAGWARYLAVVPVDQQAFDAGGDRSRELARRAIVDPELFLELDSVFPESLRNSERFRRSFVQAARVLERDGPLSAMMG
jgi:mannitol 2-dehydrogenase